MRTSVSLRGGRNSKLFLFNYARNTMYTCLGETCESATYTGTDIATCMVIYLIFLIDYDATQRRVADQDNETGRLEFYSI